MNVTIITHGEKNSVYGGGQVYVSNVADKLTSSGAHVDYMFSGFSNIAVPYLHENTKNGILSRELFFPVAWRVKSVAQCKQAIEFLEATFRYIGSDILHANGLKDISCLTAFRVNVPCVVTAHHGGIVCPAGALLNHRDEICKVPADQKSCLPCCVRSIPGGSFWLILLRFVPSEIQIRFGRWLRMKRFLYFITPLGTLALSIREKLVAIETIGKFATRLIAPSLAIRDALIRNGIPASKIVIVPHGIPLPQRHSLRPDLEKGPLRFLYVGRIDRVKGVHVMLEAFAGLPTDSYELHIVGGSITKPERRYLAKLQKRYASVNAVWHGSRPHKEIPLYLESCDVMVHPAICLEVFGLTIAEALAVGRPVIATRCGGGEAQIRDGENGMLVPPNDVLALRRALQSVIDDPMRLRLLATHTCGVVSIEQHIEELMKVYADTISEHRHAHV